MNYAEIYRKLIYPAYHRIRNDGVLDTQKAIKAFLTLDPVEREAAQRTKLSKLLTHAYASSPFYRKRFDEIGFDANRPLDHFKNIPPLTKADIHTDIDSIRAAAKDDLGSLIISSTGGSTGEKLVFYYDRHCAAMRKATDIYDMGQLGLDNGAKVAKLWGAPMDVNRATSIRGRMHSWITRTLMLSTYQLSDENMRSYADRLLSFKPDLLVSYPSPLAAFCDYLIKNNRRVPVIKYIVTSAEQLFDWQREKIESTFKCKVMNRYGSREFGDIAHEFPNASGLHVHSFRVYLEILDENNQRVKKGERGRIHITDLDNFGMPFIRYKIEDDGVWHTDGHVGSPYGVPVMEAIVGRSFDVVEAPNGNRIGGTYWTILLRSKPGIRQFQVWQKRRDEIVINYVPDDEDSGELPQASRSYFVSQIQEKCGNDMMVDFHHVDSIEQTISGKTRLVISDLNSGPSSDNGSDQ